MIARQTTRRVFGFTPAFCWTLALLAVFSSSGGSAELSEYDLKALYLRHFTQFVTWPESDEPRPFVVAIIGRDPFEGTIDSQLSRGGPPIEVRRISTPAEALDCSILFISRSENRALGRIIEAVADLPILTVGDDDSFVPRGCVLGFSLEDGKVRIAVNERAAARSRLALSSKLLRIAKSR